jgi:DNA polymerase-3 subunit alpha
VSFVHLHCHSEYSLLDGANRVDDLIRRAQELEQPALAITDHGNLHAAWEFQEKAKKAGVKPIIGMEAYVAPGDRRQRGRDATRSKPYYHLVLLARDAVGYRNLIKLSSLAFTEGFYTKPRVDRELLAQYNEGIIVSYAVADREYAEREAEFLLDPNRFNVAVTRPRSKLVLLMSDEVLRALPRDERVMTESMAVKGYSGQPWREVREIELPAPDGTPVRVTVRVR